MIHPPFGSTYTKFRFEVILGEMLFDATTVPKNHSHKRTLSREQPRNDPAHFQPGRSHEPSPGEQGGPDMAEQHLSSPLATAHVLDGSEA